MNRLCPGLLLTTLLLATLPLAACTPPAETESERLAAEDGFQAETKVYRCTASKAEIRLVTRTRPGGLHVFLPPGTAQPYLDCTYDHRDSIWEHAKLSGVDFRAQGNEPGWTLEIHEGDRLELDYDYGAGQLSVPIDSMTEDAASRTTLFTGSNGAEALSVRLLGQTCNDTMSDEVYPTRVEVEFADRRLTGCGRPLH